MKAWIQGTGAIGIMALVDRYANHQAIRKRDVGKGDLRTNLFGGKDGKHKK